MSAAVSGLKQQAFNLLASPEARQAFDLSQEPDAVRDRYGRNIHGQCVLLARRLVEHGVPLVSVNWHNDGRNFWDTHGHNFSRLKKRSDSAVRPGAVGTARRSGSARDAGRYDRGLGRRIRPAPADRRRQRRPTAVARTGRSAIAGCWPAAAFAAAPCYGRSDKHAAHPIESPVRPLGLRRHAAARPGHRARDYGA